MFCKLFHIFVADPPALDLKEPVKIPESDDWRSIWNNCDQFDRYKNYYVLVTGPNIREVPPTALQVLGRVPWSLVLDFDPDAKTDGLYSAVKSTLIRQRAVHLTLPDNLLEVNYDEAACWFMANGLREREDTLCIDFDIWRRRYLPAIRELMNRLRKAVSPQSIVVLILPSGLDGKYLRSLWESLDEVVMELAKYIVVDEGAGDVSEVANKKDVIINKCSIENLVSGLWSMYGYTSEAAQIQLPKRGSTAQEREYIFLDEAEIQYFNEDLEIVRRGLLERPVEGARVGRDFWRGNIITWHELDMEADVRRDITEHLKAEIIKRLDESRNFTIMLSHTPGAGGTTVARRIAWDLKELWPTIIIKNVSQNTAARIEKLFQLTKLPVLVIMEGTTVSPHLREHLYKELRGRNARAVFLHVVRSIKPSKRAVFFLEDPMGRNEATRFYERYKNIAMSRRTDLLRQLVSDEQMAPYRTPFFFGLFSFEEDFVHVPSFVQAHIENITDETRTLLCYLSLITRFSQKYLKDAETKALLDMSTSRPLRMNELVGDGPAKIILHREQQARILHPIIAQEILKQLSTTRSEDNKDAWRIWLADLSCSFIESLVSIGGYDSSHSLDICLQLFISREYWEESKAMRRHFSELLLSIPTEAGQHRVLETLKDNFPSEAHYWNHLGRHHIYVMGSNYKEAEKCLQKAIELDPTNDIHQHALGMVYRYEIKKQRTQLIKQKVSIEGGLKVVKDLVDKAEACFSKARELDPETEYGYITNIQLLLEVMDMLFNLSSKKTYADFLGIPGEVGTWCREKLAWAEELLRRVKLLQAQESFSRHTIECNMGILNLYGYLDAMIKSLQSLLQRPDIQKVSVRRLMAQAYYSHSRHTWESMKVSEIERIHALMDDNLQEDPTNSRDLLMWFQAYRRLDSFDILEAIDRFSGWAMREDSIEANYYLYILYFVRWRQNILKDHHFIMNHIKKCQALAGRLSRTRPYEWLSREPYWLPIAQQSELGKWNRKSNFFEKSDALLPITGTIKLIKGPQAGLIALGPLDVFFVPAYDFSQADDENETVEFFLGFSYDGLRGWSVRKHLGSAH